MQFSYYYFTARRQMDVNFQRILTRFEGVCSQDQTMDEHRRRFLDFYLFFCWNCKMLDIWCQKNVISKCIPSLTNFWKKEKKYKKKPTVFIHSLVLWANHFKPRQNPLKIDVHLPSGRKIIIWKLNWDLIAVQIKLFIFY